VLEVGVAKRGEMAPYARMLRPDVVVVTSIGTEHNRSFGNLDVTRDEKAEMVRSLSPSGLLVLNADDPNVLWMAGQTRAATITFGFSEQSDVRAVSYELRWPQGSRVTLLAGGETRVLETRLLGRTTVYAVLAAVAVALAEGVSLDDALPRISDLEPVTARLEPVQLENGAVLIRDDDKSPLEGMDAALDLLADVPATRRIVVFGDVTEPPGSQGPIYRRLGERIAAVATRAVFLGSGTESYAVGARRAGMPREALTDARRSVLRAAALLRDELEPGDVVLLKGRDLQKLERIALSLQGRPIACDIPACRFRGRCTTCAMLERGWEGYRVVT
jgi:UDP-N-acetylmuramoyl-tripeptide--D-alanyl-D-alanine ligase